MMKKITFLLSLFMIGFIANETFAQHSFTTVTGPTLVANGSPVTLNINDAGNTLDPAPASSTGSYSSFSVSVDWADDFDAWSNEADLTLTTTAGPVVIDPATTGSAGSGNATTLTFEGDFIAPYVPGTDGFLNITLNQSWAGSSASWSNITVTIFESPSCIDPDTFVTSNITTTSVDLSWNDPSGTQFDFEYVVQPQGTGMPAGAGTPISDFTVTDGTLSPATAYEAWVRADCGVNGFSNWVGPLNFNTLCNAFAVPFTEGFNSGSTTESCWTILNVNGDADAWNTNYATNPFEGDQSAMMFTDFNAGANDDWLISPTITLTGNQRLKFHYRVQSAGEPNDFELLLSTTGVAPANFTNVLIANTSYSNTTYIERIVDLTAFSGDVNIAWHVPSGGLDGWRLYIDNVIVEDLPSCLEPDTFAFSNLTDNSVDLSWNDPSGIQFDFEYVIQPQGTGMPAGAGTPISDFTVTDGTLSATTAYEAWVRADCGGDFSAWVGPLNFTTPCSVFTVPSLEDFTTYVPACWQEADNGDLATGPATFGNSGWATDGFGNVGSTGAFKYNIFTTGANDWVLSPLYDIPATGYELKFDAAATQWNSTNAPTTPWEADDFVEVLVSNGTDNWTVLYTYNDANVPSNTGTTNIIDLDAYAGQIVRFAFRVVEGAANGSADIDFSVDNFEIRLTPSCIEPNLFTASNITASSVDLTWNDPSGVQFDFEYVIQPQGTGMPAGAGTPISDFTVTDNSLSSATAYEAWVRADCGGDYSAWVGPINFSTSIEVICGTPVNTTYCYDDNDTTTWTFTSNDGSPLRITFNAGAIESCCDDILIYDGTDNSGTLLYQGNNGGDLSGLIFDSTSDSIYIEIDSDGSVSCVDTGLSPQWDFTVACATCVNPTATFTIVPDCANSQFSVEVDLTDLGTATSVTISDGTTDLTGISATGVQTFGPYADGASVTIDVTNEQDNSCTISSGALAYVCPPANDECVNAIPVNCGDVVTGSTATGATDSGNNTSADVWYSYSGAAGDITVSLCTNTNYDSYLRVFDACGGTQIAFNDDSCLAQSELTFTADGTTTYYIMVEGFTSNVGDFEMSINCTLSAEDFNSNSFVAYPNPVKDVLTLEYTSDISSVRVLNMLGQEVITRTVNAASAQVDMSQLAAGTYLVNVTSGDVQKTIKVVKQ